MSGEEDDEDGSRFDRNLENYVSEGEGDDELMHPVPVEDEATQKQKFEALLERFPGRAYCIVGFKSHVVDVDREFEIVWLHWVKEYKGKYYCFWILCQNKEDERTLNRLLAEKPVVQWKDKNNYPRAGFFEISRPPRASEVSSGKLMLCLLSLKAIYREVV